MTIDVRRSLTRAGWLAGTCLLASLLSLSGCSDDASLTAEPAPVGGPPLVRRLTESQYRNAVADIFGPDVAVVARFERGLRAEGLLAVGTSEAGISPFSIEQYDVAARSVADAVISEKNRNALLPCAPADPSTFDAVCVTQFVNRYGPMLLRRPLESAEVERFVEDARVGHSHLGDFYEGLKYSLVGMMMAPEFLLRIERDEPHPERDDLRQLDPYSKAARLSYFLVNSTPDAELLRAAEAGELDTQEGLAKQVDRLIGSPGFERAVRAFFADMLEFELFEDLAKDPAIYPAFNSDVAAHAQEQTLRTITDHLLVKNGDYRDLFTTRDTYLTRPLGVVYRLPVPTRNGWEKTEFPADSGRLGIQSHVSFLALHSHPGRSSPTLRGAAIREVFLCQEVPDPPPDVDFTIVQDPSVSLPTARDRLHAHNTEPACTGCHLVMDPPGLTLERFDGLGISRTHENGVLIDTSGSLDGDEFDTSEGFAHALRNHSETPRCLVEKLYRSAVGRDTVWEERPYMDWLIASFEKAGYKVPELMRTIVTSENFFAIQPPEEPAAKQLHASLNDEEGDRT